jgi:hypothetical protein
MSILSTISNFFGTSAAKPIEAVFNGIDDLISNDEEMVKANTELEKIKQNPVLWRFILNYLDNQHCSLFVSGPRPFNCWIIGISLALYLIPQFLIGSYIWAKHVLITGILIPYPVSNKELLELLISMGFLYGCRAFEKRKK